jgi:3-oxoacid CoA-transferase
MSARTSCSPSSIWPANSNSNSPRRARWPSASAPAAPAFPAFYTKTGVGTLISEGKPTMEFNGETYMLERGCSPTSRIVHAWKGDTAGNLVYRKTARNFNPMMATAAKITIAEVEHLVPAGEIDPDHIHTPGIFVKRIVEVGTGKKRIEQRTVPRNRQKQERTMAWTRDQMAARAAKELRDGYYVNLGIGIPTLVSNYIPEGVDVQLQSENGMLGMGPSPMKATKIRTSSMPASRPSPNCRRPAISRRPIRSAWSAAAISMSILGAMQVAQNGDLANWMIPGKMVKGMGGAMDLVAGVKRVVVVMEHSAKDGAKLLKSCNLPLTGERVVDMVVTDLGVFLVSFSTLYAKNVRSCDNRT